MSAGTVTVHPQAEPELLSLPADMRARFLRIAEMLEDFGPQQVGLPHVRLAGEQAVGNANARA